MDSILGNDETPTEDLLTALIIVLGLDSTPLVVNRKPDLLRIFHQNW